MEGQSLQFSQLDDLPSQVHHGGLESQIWARVLLGSLLPCHCLEFVFLLLGWITYLEREIWDLKVTSFSSQCSSLHSTDGPRWSSVSSTDEDSVENHESIATPLSNSLSEFRSSVVDGRSLQEEYRRQNEARTRRTIDARRQITQIRHS
jgi:hypothetical protein